MRIILAFLVLFLPGLAWWLWLGDHEQDGGEALARIFAVSFATIAALALGLFAIRVSMTPILAAVLLGVFAGAVIVGLIRNYKTAFDKTWLIALVVFAVFTGWRLWQAQELVFPNWVDSQHHALIIRAIIEKRMLPATLEPYLPGPFYYHFAYHAVTAVFCQLSGLPVEQAMLLFGQVLNAMAGFAIYAFVKTIGKDWRIGLVAALLITFVTKMPGYYLSWGRYTLLIGISLMQVAMAEAEWLRKGKREWWQAAGFCLLVAGTLLSHYLTAFLLALYLIIIGVEWLIQSLKTKQWDWKSILLLVIPSALAFLFSFRWYIRIFRYSTSVVNTFFFVPGDLKLDTKQFDYLRYILGPKIAYLLLAFTLAGIIWAFFKVDWRKLAIWSLLVALFTIPIGVMVFSFRSDYYGLMFFTVLGSLSAAFLIWTYDFLYSKIRWKKPLMIVAIIPMLVFVGWGAWRNSDVINDATVLVDKADTAALEWIGNHTEPEARFFVNTAYWGYGLYRGVDGGGWILPNTGRWSLAPTIFYTFGAEEPIASKWKDWGERASKITACDQDFWNLIQEANLNYVYVRRGTSGIQVEQLANCEGASKLYDNGIVSIWLVMGYNPASSGEADD